MDDVRQNLVRTGRAHGRAKRTIERTRAELGEAIRRAAAHDVGPAEITRLIGHELTERTVFRIIEGDDKD
jgi:hypothetical protein